MLMDMLPHCLGVPSADRHSFQNGVAEGIFELLGDAESRIKNSIDEENLKLSSAEKEQQDREKAVAAAQEALEERVNSALERKRELADAARKYRDATRGLQQAVASGEHGEVELQEAAKKRVELDTLTMHTLKPLCEHTLAAEKVQEECTTLVSTLRRYDVSDGILLALPGVMSVAPSARGDFDHVVIQKVQEETRQKLHEVENLLMQGQEIKAQRQKAVEDAQSLLQTAKTEQMSSAKAFLACDAAQKEQELVCESAKQQLREFGPAMKKVGKSAEQLQKKLSKFQDGPLANFATLKNWQVEAATTAAPAPAELN